MRVLDPCPLSQSFRCLTSNPFLQSLIPLFSNISRISTKLGRLTVGGAQRTILVNLLLQMSFGWRLLLNQVICLLADLIVKVNYNDDTVLLLKLIFQIRK